MKISVVTPVGPGHGEVVSECERTVWLAMRHSPFDCRHVLVDDTDGQLGRSAARNEGMDRTPDADWYFFIDADDLMLPSAMSTQPISDAVFGVVQTARLGRIREDRPLTTWSDLFSGPISGTLAMGAFFRADHARILRFHDRLDYGEDWEFYLAFCARWSWCKLDVPLVLIGDNNPSADGKRGYGGRQRLRWQDACEPIRAWWRERGCVPATRTERDALVDSVLARWREIGEPMNG